LERGSPHPDLEVRAERSDAAPGAERLDAFVEEIVGPYGPVLAAMPFPAALCSPRVTMEPNGSKAAGTSSRSYG